MLVLSNIHSLLTQVLEVPRLHTAAVFTPAGQLVCYVCDPIRPKDEVLLIVGLGEEVWHGSGVMESELGRIVVTPVEDVERQDEDEEPLMLVALNATRDMAWADLQSKGQVLADVLSKSWSKHREHLIVPKPVGPTPATALSGKAPPPTTTTTR
ncbi:hypothetical protein CPB85DRAFT_1295638 [Mucidula mucida]|nr:hypothetical protein CPB85DRAFT_1295638 [Mucidula mucida]